MDEQWCGLFQKAFGWEAAAAAAAAGGGGSPGGGAGGGGQVPGAGVATGQGAQGLVHWMSVMAEHMDPAVQHYMSWNQDVSTNTTLFHCMLTVDYCHDNLF